VDERLLEVRRRAPSRRPSVRVLSVLLSAALALSMIPLAAAQAEGTATLKYGMSGSSVKTLQTSLVTRGYLKSADGKFGKATQSAVKLFQKHAGLKQDGIAGVNTQSALYGLTGSAKTNQTLKNGSKNAQVKMLQQRLTDLGYLKNAKIDGIFGNVTKEAVKKFQSKAGLKQDGIAGPMTLTKLYASNAPKLMTKGDQVVAYAKQFLGVKYIYGAADPDVGFDCSGLVYYIHLHYFDIKLPRSAQGLTVAGAEVALKDARPGDILCFGSTKASVGHVGIYIGNNQYIEAPQTGDFVKISTIHRTIATVRRIFDD
jgi:cell wall-associated NlpC family hydrolase